MLKDDLHIIRQQTLDFRSEIEKMVSDVRNILLNSANVSQSLGCHLNRPSTLSSSNDESSETASKTPNPISQGPDSARISLKSIASFRSCFLTKNGTPRQPNICEYARGSLTITCFDNRAHSVDRLSSFSHLWLVFLFHENRHRGEAKTKIAPPRLNGEKVGVFATRSPHRPNPVGLSLVKLDGVSDGTLHVSGVDLIGEL